MMRRIAGFREFRDALVGLPDPPDDDIVLLFVGGTVEKVRVPARAGVKEVGFQFGAR